MILTTDDGSQTIRHDTLGELYHSSRGAVGEAMHVYIEPMIALRLNNIRIFEVGFGSGLNAILALESGLTIDYHAIELFPIEAKVAATLDYATTYSHFMELHTARWGEKAAITPNFKLTKYQADLETFDFEPLNNSIDIIFFDAFAPDTQPMLWSEKVMQRMYNILTTNGLLTTYCAKGTVKQALRNSGFTVQRYPGALGKRHMIIAKKI